MATVNQYLPSFESSFLEQPRQVVKVAKLQRSKEMPHSITRGSLSSPWEWPGFWDAGAPRPFKSSNVCRATEVESDEGVARTCDYHILPTAPLIYAPPTPLLAYFAWTSYHPRDSSLIGDRLEGNPERPPSIPNPYSEAKSTLELSVKSGISWKSWCPSVQVVRR